MGPVGGDVAVASVRVSTKNGRIRVITEDRHDISVDGRAQVTTDDGRTTVSTVNDSIVVRVPKGCDVVAGTVNGRIALEGEFGDVAVMSESGRVQVDHARSADVRTTSARIQAGRVEGDFRAHTSSGRVTAEACGAADVSTVSGRITLSAVSGPVHAHCTSGRIEIDLVTAADVEAETVSGRISISLPSGVRAHRPTDPSEAQPPDCDCTVIARSVSGRVTVS